MVWEERPKRQSQEKHPKHVLPQGKRCYRPDFKASLNGNVLSTVDKVDYLGHTFARHAKWTNHVEGIFKKCVRLSFFCKETAKAVNTYCVYSQIRRGVRNTYYPLLFASYLFWAS